MQVVRRPYIFIYNNELDIVERGLINLSAAEVKLADELAFNDEV